MCEIHLKRCQTLTCLISRLLGLTIYLFIAICRGPGTHDCLSWPTKTRQHGGVNIPAFSISSFLSWQPEKPRTGVSIIWIYFQHFQFGNYTGYSDGSSLMPFRVSSLTYSWKCFLHVRCIPQQNSQ